MDTSTVRKSVRKRESVSFFTFPADHRTTSLRIKESREWFRIRVAVNRNRYDLKNKDKTFKSEAKLVRKDQLDRKDQPGRKDQNRSGRREQDQLGRKKQDQLGRKKHDQLVRKEQDLLGRKEQDQIDRRVPSVNNYLAGKVGVKSDKKTCKKLKKTSLKVKFNWKK